LCEEGRGTDNASYSSAYKHKCIYIVLFRVLIYLQTLFLSLSLCVFLPNKHHKKGLNNKQPSQSASKVVIFILGLYKTFQCLETVVFITSLSFLSHVPSFRYLEIFILLPSYACLLVCVCVCVCVYVKEEGNYC
jgi:hypothetical protein